MTKATAAVTGEVTGLNPAQGAWCDAQASIVLMTADSLGLISDEFIATADETTDELSSVGIGGTFEGLMVSFRIDFDFQKSFGSELGENRRGDVDLSLAFAREVTAVHLISQSWFQFQQTEKGFEAWKAPAVVEACAAAYEAFR